ncbi:transposase [Lactococcus piscium]|uniref:Transposase n=1 Tax=Pseudolactococcus piscium TaxID=1364 RepID=A0A2A5S686_9LACT|nr:IS3 family transposase [Lactococcus piscium]MDN5463746.1 IS3 family transposase [Lactococcus lactis]PCS08951.1 transposase [Lactococcus piscium]
MIQNLITGFSVSTVIETLGLSRSTYYAQINRKKSKTQVEQERLAFQIHKEYQNAKGRYGASKIHQKLIQSSNNCSLKRVQRLMRKMGLQANTRKKWKPKTPVSSDRKHLSNLLKQDFIASRLNEKWSTDITYIHTVKDEWCYLSSIMDLYSKKIIAWDFSKTMEKELVLQTIEKVAYRVNDGLILQTDKAVNIF